MAAQLSAQPASVGRCVPVSGCSTKMFATLQARAALAGVQLVRSDDDRGREVFCASHGALTKRFETLAEVEDWLATRTFKAEA